jgi:hypothetical protein
MNLLGRITGLILTVGLAGSAHATSFLVNGSFETGDFTGWGESGNLDFVSVLSSGVTGVAAEDGRYYVDVGSIGSDAFFSQTFADTPGQTLRISGWVRGDGGSPSDVGFYFNHITKIGGIPKIYISPVPNQPWTLYTSFVTASGLDTFSVGARNDPGDIQLDNFSIVSVGARATPAPPAWIIMLTGLAAIGLVTYRRQTRGMALTAA